MFTNLSESPPQSRPLLMHVINSLGVGGAEVLLAGTIKLLSEYDHVVVVRYALTSENTVKLPENVRVHSLNAKSLRGLIGGILRLRRLIRRYRPALVHTHLQVASIFAKLACPRRIPLFYTLHSTYSDDPFGIDRRALITERFTARPYHHLIAVSQAVADDYQGQVPRSGSMDVLHNFVDSKFFQQTPPSEYVPGTPLRCVSVGNLKLQKNHGYTLRSFDRIKGLPVSLDIWGQGDLKGTLQNHIETSGLKNKVVLKGTSSIIEKVLPQYHLYILASTYEGFCIAALEALACGLPSLLSDLPVFREVADTTALYFSIKDEEALSNLLTGIYNGDIRISELSATASKRAANIASETQYIQRLRNIYSAYLH